MAFCALLMACNDQAKPRSSNTSQANPIEEKDEGLVDAPSSLHNANGSGDHRQVILEEVDFCGQKWPLSTTGVVCFEPRDAPKPLSLEPLTQLKDLKKLILDNTSVVSIAPLASLEQLESLNLNDTPVEDLTPLSGLKKMKRLSLSDVPNVKSFGSIRNLTHLEYLNVNSNKAFNDPSVTSGLKKLETLIVSYTGLIMPPEIPEENQVTELDMSSTEVKTIAGLKRLKSLRKLSLSETKVEDLSPLKEITTLESLNISSTPVVDISPLQYNDSLKDLAIYKTKIKNLDSVKKIKGLTIYGKPE